VKIPQQIHGVPPPRHFYRWYDANSVHSELSTNTSYSAAAAAAVAYNDYHHQLNHHPHHYHPTLNHHPNLHNVYPLHLSYYPTPVDASVQHHQHLPPPTHSTAFYHHHHHHAGQAAAAAPIPSPATTAYPWMSYYHPMYAYHEAATPAEESMPVTPVSTATSGSHHHHQRHYHHSSAHQQYTTGGNNDTTISSSPSWWAHLEQVAHMGMATPSTPRRPPRKTPHKSMTKS
jgi:hypothetical protein